MVPLENLNRLAPGPRFYECRMERTCVSVEPRVVRFSVLTERRRETVQWQQTD